MKNTLLFVLYIFFCGNTVAQRDNIAFKKKIDSLSKIDFINRTYKYLDQNLKPNIPEVLYRETFVKNKFIERPSYKYSDSVSVCLMAEFNDDVACRIAKIQITYTWLRVGYHLLLSAKECQDLANSLHITKPFLFQRFVRDNPKNDNVIEIMTGLRNRVLYVKPELNFENLTNNELLNLGLKYNPVRIDDLKKLIESRKMR